MNRLKGGLFLTSAAAVFAFSGASWAGLFSAGIGEGSMDASPRANHEKASTKASATTDVSDLWWNPGESGWGMQLVQNNNFIFATLFVYGADGKPTWYTATLNNAGGFTWTGPLYATTGPGFVTVPFDAGSVHVRQAGSMTFHAIDIANGTLNYTVDGTAITKNVTRQTLVNEAIGGVYDVVTTQTQSCVPQLGGDGTFSNRLTLSLSQSGNSVVGQTPGCTFTGTYDQFGKMGAVAGTYSCSWGEAGSFQLFEITVTETGMLARLSEHSNLCTAISAQAAGLRN